MQAKSTREYMFYSLFGLGMGITLSLGGLTDFGEIHSLFILQNIPMLLVFAVAIGLSMLGFMFILRGKQVAKKPFTKGTLPGSVLFGVGWALTGACPSIALVQLGEGKIAAALTISGILAGVWMYRKGTATMFQFDTGICGEE